jgi:hypothetical protein
MDSNHRRQSQQIYSLPHLATLESALRKEKRTFLFFLRQPMKEKNLHEGSSHAWNVGY